jgi:hypothetical protein
MAKRKMMTVDEAKPCKRQHKTPCGDCPFHREAIPGWLGGSTPETYVAIAHSDAEITCHTKIGPQCAGAAIYRNNVLKEIRYGNLDLPADKEIVFSTPMEFLEHHKQNE